MLNFELFGLIKESEAFLDNFDTKIPEVMIKEGKSDDKMKDLFGEDFMNAIGTAKDALNSVKYGKYIKKWQKAYSQQQFDEMKFYKVAQAKGKSAADVKDEMTRISKRYDDIIGEIESELTEICTTDKLKAKMKADKAETKASVAKKLISADNEIASHKLGVTKEFLDKLQDDKKEADAAYKEIEDAMNGEIEKAAAEKTKDMGANQKVAWNAARTAAQKTSQILQRIEAKQNDDDNPYKENADETMQSQLDKLLSLAEKIQNASKDDDNIFKEEEYKVPADIITKDNDEKIWKSEEN